MDTRLARLTPKEIACLRLVARGLSSKEIASELGIAKTSVDTYCNRARGKLEVGGRHEAARLVRRALSADDGAAAAAGAEAFATSGQAMLVPRVAALASASLKVLAAGLVAILAAGAFIAGFHALDAMRPPGAPSRFAAAAHTLQWP